jgi:hypothetical protein
MSVQQDLLDLGDLFNFCDLSTFTQNIPIEWVASALDLSSQATIRRRRLPADQVLWLVLGMALFRDEPVHEVARRLNICAQGLASDHLLARSGVTEARKRLGADPVEWLFRKTGTQWGAQRYDDDAWHDLQVFAVDGALLRTPDTPELRDHFGSGNTPSERQTPFPMLRLVALMNVRSHVILDAQLSPYRRSEMRLADEFLQQIPDHSVTLFDKGFWGAELLSSLSRSGTHRHWLIPAKLPAETYNTKAVAKLYQERWEIELGFRDIKSSMQQNAMTLRSKKVELIYQEVWGLLLAYNIIRREASQAAVAFGRAPSDIRFKPACQYIAVQLIVMAAANPISATGRRLAELRAGIGGLFLDHRPRPSRPRTVKISKTRFPVDRKAAPLK